jgi:hypothetical protein
MRDYADVYKQGSTIQRIWGILWYKKRELDNETKEDRRCDKKWCTSRNTKTLNKMV